MISGGRTICVDRCGISRATCAGADAKRVSVENMALNWVCDAHVSRYATICRLPFLTCSDICHNLLSCVKNTILVRLEPLDF